VTTTEIDIDAPPAITHAVITDADTYPQWLVGAKRIRRVDPDWPAEGSKFHHAVGFGPLTIKDSTSVLHHPDESDLELVARIGVVGSARVHFHIAPLDDGSRSHLSVDEQPASGPMRALWSTPARPLVAAGFWGRNAISLQSLRALVEERWEARENPGRSTG
jgi:hypothetical protein